MKRSKDADPIRWRDLPPSRSEIETEIGEATRLLGTDAPPDELRLAQVRQRLLPRLRAGTARATVFARPWLRVAALVIVSLGLGGVATAITGRLIVRYRRVEAPPPAVVPQGARTPRRAARRWRVAVNAPTQIDLSVGPDGTEVAVVAGQAEISASDVPGAVSLVPGGTWREGVVGGGPVSAAPVPKGTGVARPRPTSRPVVTVERRRDIPRKLALAEVRITSVNPPVPSPLPASVTLSAPSPGMSPPDVEPSPLAATRASLSDPLAAPAPRPSEAALLGQALRRLRTDRDPRAALVQLDDHDRRFPSGKLGREAALARAEALLALDRKATALAVLDALKLEGATVDRRVALARAELRVAGGRRADAIADFDAVLDSDVDDDIAARALFGRAVLSVRSGDTVGARDDLREYLQRFGKGARRFEAARILRRLGN